MNRRREADHVSGAPRKLSNCTKDREEELSFFREIQRRDKDRFVSLLQPVSVEFEANGNHELYIMEPGKKGPAREFLSESEKNDYNWLKTPPATPLFQSLEMETNAPGMVVHRELPIIQPLSRFAGKLEETKANTNMPSTPNTKQKVQQRHKTANLVTPTSLTEKKNMKTAPLVDQKTSKPETLPTEKLKTMSIPAKSSGHREERQPNFLVANLSKSMRMDFNASTRPKKRDVSPFVRPTTPVLLLDKTPPNLRTDRSASVTRGRPTTQDHVKARTRQSCSPSVTRGHKVDNTIGNDTTNQAAGTRGQPANKGQVLGSRMVDKFMNARRTSSNEEQQARLKMNGSVNDSPRFGSLMSKSSLNMAHKHMGFQRESINTRTTGIVSERKSITNSNVSSKRRLAGGLGHRTE